MGTWAVLEIHCGLDVARQGGEKTRVYRIKASFVEEARWEDTVGC